MLGFRCRSAVSQNRGAPIQTLKYYSAYYWDPQKGPKFGKPPIFPYSLLGTSKSSRRLSSHTGPAASTCSQRFGGHLILRWILKILHDPKYPIPWEYWYYSILRSCRIFSINSRVYGLEFSSAYTEMSRYGIPSRVIRNEFII